jgi:hypothetical protein
MNTDPVAVPCGTCRLCCKRTLIALTDEDDAATYETEMMHGVSLVLKHKPNGDCIYLGDEGCTIHDRAPVLCRVYDCREQYRTYNREQRRDMVARGLLDPEVLKRAAILIREEKR